MAIHDDEMPVSNVAAAQYTPDEGVEPSPSPGMIPTPDMMMEEALEEIEEGEYNDVAGPAGMLPHRPLAALLSQKAST